MDTTSYLARLESLLGGLPIAERQYAIAYYTEYLLDAGPDGAASAIAALGTPESLAAQIKAEAAIRGLDGSPAITGPTTANPAAAGVAGGRIEPAAAAGLASPSPAAQYSPPAPETRSATSSWPGQQPQSQQPQANPQPQPQAAAQPNFTTRPAAVPTPVYTAAPPQQSSSGLKVLLIVLLAIFAIPIGVPVAAAIFGLVVALFSTLLGFIVAVVATAFTLILGGVFGLVVGGMLIPLGEPAIGVFYIGMGLAVLGLGLLFSLAMYELIRVIFKGLALLFNAIRRRLFKKSTTPLPLTPAPAASAANSSSGGQNV